MNEFLWGWLVMAAPAMLLSAGMVPSRFANQHAAGMNRIATLFTGVSFVLAVIHAAMLAAFGKFEISLLTLPLPATPSLGVYFDALTAIMFLLVSFVGFIITRYSDRYLAGDQTQGRFFRWISFTLGAVLLMVISNNLVLFTIAWMLTSFGLHQLLTHYGHRPGAVIAARKKFVISRLGDVMLIAALALTYRLFGSCDYSNLFTAVTQLGDSQMGALTLISLLYVIGAMTKSAQFPFHSWLPDTMETPTPVSALMHAGVINAGGFLVIRLSPLIGNSHLALDLLAGIGAVTALLGVVVMITQTSVKRSLAYSTIAQMGFMMLQCGLGAFSSALLHIVAHSLYKAHAFLTSGTLVDAEATKFVDNSRYPRLQRTAIFLFACLLAISLGVAASKWFGSTSPMTPGGLILGVVLITALTHLLWKSFSTKNLRASGEGVIKAIAVTVIYYAAFSLVNAIVSPVLPQSISVLSLYDLILLSVVLCGFLFVFVLQEGLDEFRSRSLMRWMYVHASQGFYMDVMVRRLTSRT